jgi:hypothetical protein
MRLAPAVLSCVYPGVGRVSVVTGPVVLPLIFSYPRVSPLITVSPCRSRFCLQLPRIQDFADRLLCFQELAGKRGGGYRRLNSSLKKDSIAVEFRVELAFRPASKPLFSCSESASADGTGGAGRVFQQTVRPSHHPQIFNRAAKPAALPPTPNHSGWSTSHPSGERSQ